ncbi:vWA domain-containing protein [Tsukamurella soli]|uniref:VWFA domain-containing protein n=1 Tax=Tsukamurella soli TaxID=644556 RepID=A0ABP8JPG5_9ACTN
MEPQGTILPVYFVADESGSMGPYVGELNDGLINLQDALQRESFAAAKVRFSVIGFADDARTYLEPADLRSLPQMPALQARGLTSYQAAFDQIGYRISVDVPSLKAEGYMVNRPAVFFLTDGAPNNSEDWRAARDYLLAQPAAANILAFGIGQADAATVREVATKDQYAFIAARGVDTGMAISEFITSLTQSVISSGQALASGAGQLQMEKPEGFSLAVDLV